MVVNGGASLVELLIPLVRFYQACVMPVIFTQHGYLITLIVAWLHPLRVEI
jgi:hypothetical protein